ncbi:MAG: cation transporter [Bacteroides sp.]|nr:cation transporter [Eubacterium sp.]MCM1418286.1 cation transporter [Roseburia sp.]MCM1462389.1 cation transporter [Bacteroides sp.]
MIKTTLKIRGMACGMCEAHINDAVRKSFSIKKVTSSFRKGTTEILSEDPLDMPSLRAAIADTGYEVLEASEAPYEKRGIFKK